ncbi:unnamed protein product [Medioppia subpectinata]|uniref:Uncharacterized protein n=1 Tax=Medioppia subpectinata TaxID=1979941 RepID=A0A7R9L7J3_9ACAR|nr:unnamed protein product [Medioppia subpectinata]CAG2116691.1 unnamed protein product [Medioppia subpectinata]
MTAVMTAIPVDKPESKFLFGFGFGGFNPFPFFGYPYFPQSTPELVSWPINMMGLNGTVLANSTAPINATAPAVPTNPISSALKIEPASLI